MGINPMTSPSYNNSQLPAYLYHTQRQQPRGWGVCWIIDKSERRYGNAKEPTLALPNAPLLYIGHIVLNRFCRRGNVVEKSFSLPPSIPSKRNLPGAPPPLGHRWRKPPHSPPARSSPHRIVPPSVRHAEQVGPGSRHPIPAAPSCVYMLRVAGSRLPPQARRVASRFLKSSIVPVFAPRSLSCVPVVVSRPPWRDEMLRSSLLGWPKGWIGMVWVCGLVWARGCGKVQ